jgi:hypothetical protein
LVDLRIGIALRLAKPPDACKMAADFLKTPSGGAPMAERHCRACGAKVDRRDRFCRECGAGVGAPTLERRRSAKRREEPTGAMAYLIGFLNIFPGLIHPAVVVMSIVATVVGAAVCYLAVVLFMFGGWIAAFAIGGAGVVCYWTAIVWMQCGYLCAPTEGLADFDSLQWTIFVVLGFAPLAAFFALTGGG